MEFWVGSSDEFYNFVGGESDEFGKEGEIGFKINSDKITRDERNGFNGTGEMMIFEIE